LAQHLFGNLTTLATHAVLLSTLLLAAPAMAQMDHHQDDSSYAGL
jgi:hypothetical protein